MCEQYQQDLDGIWKLRLDRDRIGIEKGYYKIIWEEIEEEDAKANYGTIRLPGILQAQGYGDKISQNTPWISGLHDNMWYLREEYKGAQEGEVNVPFLSQPPRHYLGWAWYQREVLLPKEGQYQLFLECTRWKTTVWVDGEEKGSITSLCAPHCYLLGRQKAGKHQITILIDNEMQYPYRPDGHMVSDALAATWNGIVGEISLRKLPDIRIVKDRIDWNIEIGKATIELTLQNLTKEQKNAKVSVTKMENQKDQKIEARDQIEERFSIEEQILCELLPEEEKTYILTLFYSKENLFWDEYEPNRKQIKLFCQCEEEMQVIQEQFGFRKMETKEDGFFINERPVYMRGTHFGGDFPLTGYPATGIEEWEHIFTICKRWGLNFMRFHSYCPPQAAFLAADKLGFYLQIECGMWNYFSEQTSLMSEVLYCETKRILDAFGNHPSFVMFSPSNEPAGDWLEPLKKWTAYFRKTDNRRLYTIQSGWPYPMEPEQIDGTDYIYFHRSGFGPYQGGTIRNKSGWFGKDYLPSLKGIHYPVICHEMGQWCSYPDFSIIQKFTGYMRPGNYQVFRAQAEKKGVLSQNSDFVYHSGRLQVAMYKEDFEANFRTPHLYGFEMLDLHDYLGQGGAFIGVLDAFWEEKGYIKPEEFKEFCNETVLLLRMPKYIFTKTENPTFSAEIAHFGKAKIQEALIKWNLRDSNGTMIKEEFLCKREIPLGKNIPLGTISLSLQELKALGCYTIELVLERKTKKTEVLKNHWDFWLYEEPVQYEKLIQKEQQQKENILVLTDFRKAKKALQEGKSVLLSPPVFAFSYWCPPLSQRTVFWNSQMGPRYSRNLGLICDVSHLALSEFPTKSYEEWQWAGIMEGARGINLNRMNPKLKPIVQVIDEWNRSYKMALLLEAKVGKGKLLLSGCTLDDGTETCPQRAQLKKSLYDYIHSEAFCPEIELTEEEAFSCFQDTLLLKKLGATCWIEELPDVDCSDCISVNPEKAFELEQVTFPLHLHIKWKQKIWINGFVYLPVQNRRDHSGDIREYEIWAREEKDKTEKWVSKKCGEFETSFEPKELFFDRCLTDEIIFVIKSGFGCEYYQKWKVTEDGWKREIGSFMDQAVRIGELLVLSEEWIEGAENETENSYHFLEGKTATLEIEE